MDLDQARACLNGEVYPKLRIFQLDASSQELNASFDLRVFKVLADQHQKTQLMRVRYCPLDAGSIHDFWGKIKCYGINYSIEL